jgi:hypothetical protein
VIDANICAAVSVVVPGGLGFVVNGAAKIESGKLILSVPLGVTTPPLDEDDTH